MNEGKVTPDDIASPLAFARRNIETAAAALAALRSTSPFTFRFWLYAYLSRGYDRIYRATLPNSFYSWPLLPAPRPLTLPTGFIRPGYTGALVVDPPYAVMKYTWEQCSMDFDRIHIVLRGILDKLGGEEDS
ncbi:hypothetical protein DM860_017118 [Cuscuta australis]|uniref:Uncharacterized protein n=1 Tax=Cuscuta australis TaxID=267555 RepID=A0A328DN17_9ASTE|nr:hypothetical protein DM860_017118 [Cuscuta australis]